MDLHFCPFAFLWFFSQFAILLHFGPLVRLSGFVPFWLASLPQHLTLHTTWTYNKYQFTAKTYIEGGKKKKHSCHSFFPPVPPGWLWPPPQQLRSDAALSGKDSSSTPAVCFGTFQEQESGAWERKEQPHHRAEQRGCQLCCRAALPGNPWPCLHLCLQFTFANSHGGKADEQH